jgi:LuxR family maltose regulon positive regulatory protein
MLQNPTGGSQTGPSTTFPATIAGDRPLLHTKLHVPKCPPSLLPRSRLTAQLHSPPNMSLTLLTAPAGFGKTTLVAEWLQQQTLPAAWLSLDEQDNDPVLFWRYLIAALQEIDNQFGQQALAVLATFPRNPLETVVTFLINDIISHTAGDRALTLVLDDFHWIHNAVIHQSFNYLLQHQPAQLHVVLLTRADPPLSLARLRVDGRLVELRSADLRMTQDEVSTFLTEIMALALPPEDLQLLMEQTEGWAAGLQLAALSLRRRDSSSAKQYLQSFAVIRQHIFAYMMEEVLLLQADDVRQFLQQTAVLRQFCAPLCTAVTGNAEAAKILRQLIADNLFITTLDDEGVWYHYHPLFAEFLRSNLDEPALRECHRRAADWYAEQGMIQDAMRNALAAADYDLMASLLTRTYKTFLATGLLASLQTWLSKIPADYQSPRLRLASAWCRVYEMGDSELEQAIADILADSAASDISFQGEILAVRAVYASLYGSLDQSIAWANEALTLIDEGDFLSLAAAYLALGNTYRNQGKLDAAIDAYTQSYRHFTALGNVIMAQLPLYRIASIQVMQGRLHHAWQTYETLRENAQAAGYEPLIWTGEVFGYLSALFLEWHDLEKAFAYAQQEIELAKLGHTLLGLVDGYLKLAAVCTAQENEDAAREALDLAVETAVPLRSAPINAKVAMHQASLELSWGNLPAADAWAVDHIENRRRNKTRLSPLESQAADLLLAKIWLAQRRVDAVLGLINEILPAFKTGGQVRQLTEALILRSLAYAAQGRETMTKESLIQALELAKPEGYVRVFVENGSALIPLLYQVRYRFPDYVTSLLNNFSAGANPAIPLLDSLTEREREIMELIALGYSNRQIADELFISVGTVKGHINHILSKLNVNNRTKALLRARELNLIS